MKVTTITPDQFIQGNYMTQTKVIGESVKQTDRNFVKAYTDDYAKAITENYRQYHIHTLTGNLSGNYPEYAREQLDAIENGTANLMWFKVYSGKRYYKIVQQEFETWSGSKYFNQYRDASVHAFVDKDNYLLIHFRGYNYEMGSNFVCWRNCF